MPVNKLNQGFKLTVETAFALWAILFLAPLFLFIALSVLNFHGRPVLFTASRIGKGARPFRLLKFRSMTNDRDERGELLPDEKRLTPFGKLLRRTSLDELPQLFNILRGEMALIGPRPILPKQIGLVPEEQRIRFHVRPGMTSWTSVNFLGVWRSWDEKMRLEAEYVRNYSLWFDVKIFSLTFWALICRFFRYRSGETPGAEELKRLEEQNLTKND